MAYGVAGLGRFRANVSSSAATSAWFSGVIPTKIRTVEELNLERHQTRFAKSSAVSCLYGNDGFW